MPTLQTRASILSSNISLHLNKEQSVQVHRNKFGIKQWHFPVWLRPCRQGNSIVLQKRHKKHSLPLLQ